MRRPVLVWEHPTQSTWVCEGVRGVYEIRWDGVQYRLAGFEPGEPGLRLLSMPKTLGYVTLHDAQQYAAFLETRSAGECSGA